MKYNSEIACSAEMISRFMDNELHGDDLSTVQRHVQSCESCRERVDSYSRISSGLKSFINEQTWASGQEIETRVIDRIEKTNSLSQWVKDIILSKRVFIPAGVAVSLSLASLIFFNNPVPAGPTAIVSSLSGTGSSIMILETNKSRQTILWVKENG